MEVAKKESNTVIKTVLIIVTVLAAMGVFAFIAYGKRIACSMHEEVFRLTYQFLSFVVLGGGISVLFSIYQRKREDKQKQREKKEIAEKEMRTLQKKFYNDFVQTYKEAKKVRRLLRARARKMVDSNVMIKTSEYDLLMKELTVIQLKCEFLRDEIKCSPELFATKEREGSPLYDHLRIIENYLNKLVSEYEKRFEHFPGQYYLSEVEFFPLDSLEKLKDFITRFDDSRPYQEFQRSVHAVLTILLQKIAVGTD